MIFPIICRANRKRSTFLVDFFIRSIYLTIPRNINIFFNHITSFVIALWFFPAIGKFLFELLIFLIILIFSFQFILLYCKAISTLILLIPINTNQWFAFFFFVKESKGYFSRILKTKIIFSFTIDFRIILSQMYFSIFYSCLSSIHNLLKHLLSILRHTFDNVLNHFLLLIIRLDHWNDFLFLVEILLLLIQPFKEFCFCFSSFTAVISRF